MIHKKQRKYYPADDVMQGRTDEEIKFGTIVYAAKLKVTKARMHILEALSHFDRPISIKELSATPLLKEHNIVTLYRTLETLATARLVRKVSFGAAGATESLYETNVGRPHHHHIVCTSCGMMEDIDACAHIPSPRTLAIKGFAKITDHSLEFFGLCKKCAMI